MRLINSIVAVLITPVSVLLVAFDFQFNGGAFSQVFGLTKNWNIIVYNK